MKKTKFFILTLLVLFFINIFTIHSSAFTFSNDGDVVDLGTEIDDNLLDYTLVVLDYTFSASRIGVFVYTSNSPFFMYPLTGKWYLANDGGYKRYEFKDIANIGKFSTYENNNLSHSIMQFDVFNPSAVKYSSHDVLKYDGELAFQKPVQPLGVVLENSNPVKTFQTTMSGMILSLMVFLVSLVGFWKAWSILSKSLRKA